MRNGLYKIDFETAQGFGRGIAVARDGGIAGGNSAFAFIGGYRGTGDEISADISILRHNNDAVFKELFGADEFSLPLTGKRQVEHLVLEADASRATGIVFKAVLTGISEAAAPPAGAEAAGGIPDRVGAPYNPVLHGLKLRYNRLLGLHERDLRRGDGVLI